MRWVVKIYYNGSEFKGYSRQPTGDTVENHIITALQNLSLIESPSKSCFVSASRTDRGVSALGNVVGFTAKDKELILSQLNHELKWRVIAWAYARVSADFNPRKAALYRKYVYADYYHGEDWSLMCEAADIASEAGAVRFKSGGAGLVLSADIVLRRKILLFKVKIKWASRGFIRRLWAAIKSVGAGKTTIREFRRIISGRLDFPALSPPHGLLLLDVALPIKLTPDQYSLTQLLRRLRGRIELYSMLCALTELQKSSLSRLLDIT